jgi:emfourin
MKIIVERSGGFAGIIRRGEKDLAALLPEQHAALQKLLAAGAPADARPAGADRFTFRIEVQDEHGTRSLTLPEALMPACLAAIATQL